MQEYFILFLFFFPSIIYQMCTKFPFQNRIKYAHFKKNIEIDINIEYSKYIWSSMEDNNLHRSLDWITQCHEPSYDKNEYYKHYIKKKYKKLHPLKPHYPISKTWKTTHIQLL